MKRFGVHEDTDLTPKAERQFDAVKLSRAILLFRKHVLEPEEISFLEEDEALTKEAARRVQEARLAERRSGTY